MKAICNKMGEVFTFTTIENFKLKNDLEFRNVKLIFFFLVQVKISYNVNASFCIEPKYA